MGDKEMRKHAEDLAISYGFQKREEYYDYIVSNLIDGKRQQVRAVQANEA